MFVMVMAMMMPLAIQAESYNDDIAHMYLKVSWSNGWWLMVDGLIDQYDAHIMIMQSCRMLLIAVLRQSSIGIVLGKQKEEERKKSFVCIELENDDRVVE